MSEKKKELKVMEIFFSKRQLKFFQIKKSVYNFKKKIK